MPQRRVVAAIPFGYTSDLDLDRGEIFELRGLVNDDLLLGLGYVYEYKASEHSSFQCDACGRRFIDEGSRLGHRRKAGGCQSGEQEATNAEVARLAGSEPGRFKVEDPAPYLVDTVTEKI